MPTRRDTLKTVAAGTVIGSLSGCVQLATQRTVEYNGTPAMLNTVVGGDYLDGALALGMGVEGRKTVERFGVTREIVAHSWGMLYTISGRSWTGDSGGRWAVATFTTPSIKIAGQELNPIKNLTVGEIGGEFATTTLPVVGDAEAGSFRTGGSIGSPTRQVHVDDATGKKVLRAFRDTVSAGKSVEGNGVIDFQDKGWDEDGTTFPGWDGDTYDSELTWSTGEGDAGTYTAAIRFDKHDGDFVVVFGAGGDGSTQVLESVSTAKIVQKTAPWTVRPDPPQASDPTIIHPADDQFSRDQLDLHLLDANLHGAEGMVSQARKLIDETQELLATASNKTRNEENNTFRVISDTQDDLKQLDTVLGGLGEDLQSVINTGGYGNGTPTSGTLVRIGERSKKAAVIATRAHERITSYNNDTRNEEDDRFVAIEQNLSGIKRLSRTVGEAIEYLENNAKDD